MRRTRPPNAFESAFQILRIQLLQPDTQQVSFQTKAGKFSLFFFSLVQCSILLGVFSSFVLANIINSNEAPTRDTMRNNH
ncbi:hypothetical protein M3Y97_00999000 [Aphelenchoides bicaudatus]|nr:hypothetical protein M3Y97_00999000 [Aphelenchoides bicaudatus]